MWHSAIGRDARQEPSSLQFSREFPSLGGLQSSSKNCPLLASKEWTANKPLPGNACCTLCFPRLSLHTNPGTQNSGTTAVPSQWTWEVCCCLSGNASLASMWIYMWGLKQTFCKSISINILWFCNCMEKESSHAFFSVRQCTWSWKQCWCAYSQMAPVWVFGDFHISEK